MPNKKILAILLIISLLSPELITAPTIHENHRFAKIKSSYQTFKRDIKDLLNPRKQCNHAQKRNVATKVSGMAAILVVGIVGVTACGAWYKRIFTEGETDREYVIRYIDARKSGKEITPPRDLQESLQRTKRWLGIVTDDDWDPFIQTSGYGSHLGEPEQRFLFLLRLLREIDKTDETITQAIQKEELSQEDAIAYFLPIHEKFRETILELEKLAGDIEGPQKLLQHEEDIKDDEESSDTD